MVYMPPLRGLGLGRYAVSIDISSLRDWVIGAVKFIFLGVVFVWKSLRKINKGLETGYEPDRNCPNYGKIGYKRSAKHTMKTPCPTNTTAKREKQRLAFPVYDEEDILDLDAVVYTPPPRQSGTIRVKLIYEEPSEPMPVEDLWEK